MRTSLPMVAGCLPALKQPWRGARLSVKGRDSPVPNSNVRSRAVDTPVVCGPLVILLLARLSLLRLRLY